MLHRCHSFAMISCTCAIESGPEDELPRPWKQELSQKHSVPDHLIQPLDRGDALWSMKSSARPGSDEASPVLEFRLPIPDALQQVEGAHLLADHLRVEEWLGFKSHWFANGL